MSVKTTKRVNTSARGVARDARKADDARNARAPGVPPKARKPGDPPKARKSGDAPKARESGKAAPLLVPGVARDARKTGDSPKAREPGNSPKARKTNKTAPLLASGAVSAPLLTWYDRHRRVLPWRALPGQVADPYKVWLSEIMLQQTTVAAVGPYFQRFLSRWPTVAALAASPLDDLLAAWAGLGYYARARNLHKCAGTIARDHGGTFPDTEDGLRQLPGIGPYTAGAIAAIAFDRKASAVDGNVERVVARLFAVTTPLPAAKPELRALTARLVPDARAGDFAQAMMDLGATICTPRKPACVLCPLNASCAARQQGIAADLPARAPKKPRPTRRSVAFWIERENVKGEIEVLLRRRPPKGLLGGMLEIPGSDWKHDAEAEDAATLAQSPIRTKNWRLLPGIVRHGFTHFELETTVLTTRVGKSVKSPSDGIWLARAALDTAGLPTVMWKVVKHVAHS